MEMILDLIQKQFNSICSKNMRQLFLRVETKLTPLLAIMDTQKIKVSTDTMLKFSDILQVLNNPCVKNRELHFVEEINDNDIFTLSFQFCLTMMKLLHVCTAISLMNMIIYECTSQKSFTHKPLVNKLRLNHNFFSRKSWNSLSRRLIRLWVILFQLPVQLRYGRLCSAFLLLINEDMYLIHSIF